ncbi:MAG: hypothetical protein D6823_06850, partial [Chloroflexi bacterium]
ADPKVGKDAGSASSESYRFSVAPLPVGKTQEDAIRVLLGLSSKGMPYRIHRRDELCFRLMMVIVLDVCTAMQTSLTS